MSELKNTYQEYWDACLIRAWRNFQTVGEMIEMFKSITKANTTDGLLRKPKPFINSKMGVRVFSSHFLPDINEWLHNHPADKDILLARKLATSKYDTFDKPFKTNAEKDIAKNRRDNKKNMEKVKLGLTWYQDRNEATDWNVTKGKARIKRR